MTLLLMLGLVVGGAKQDRREIQDTAKGKSGEQGKGKSVLEGRGKGKGRKKVCRGKDKQVYKEGEGYTEDCVTYTCSRLGKRVVSLVPSVVGACCELRARGLFPAGQVPLQWTVS